MRPVEYLQSARHDFDESLNWYAERSLSAAAKFAAAVDAAMVRVTADPTQFATLDGMDRECPVKDFRIALCIE